MAKKAKVQPASTNWLFKGIVFLGMVLMVAGIFGVILINKEYDATVNFKHYFDVIKELKDAEGSQASGFRSTSYINIITFFFSILITVIPTLVLLLKQKKEINVKKAFAFAATGSLIYLFATTVLWNGGVLVKVGSYSETMAMSFGWGSILIIVGFAIGLLGIILSELIDTKSFITLRNIFAKAGLVAIFFIAIFGSIAVSISQESGSIAKENISFSLFSAINAFIDSEKGSGIGMTAIVFSVISFVFFALTAYKFIYNNPEKKGNTIIVFSGIYFVTALISNICVISYVTTVFGEAAKSVTINLGSGAIVQLVLGLLVVVAAILTRVFRKTDREVA